MENLTPKEDPKLVEAKKKYAEFEEKVKRTVYIDNLSPQVTESVMNTAISQFGSVVNIHFIPNYTISLNIPKCALVEMKTPKEANAVIEEIQNFPFMIGGMPRPVRALPAEPEMFDDRPPVPGLKIHCRWLDPKDPDFEVAKKLKTLTRKHASESLSMLKHQLQEEAKLARQQNETLRAKHGNLEMIENVMSDGTASRLARHYGMEALDNKNT